ncbi:MAG: RNA polymerase sigma factor [Bacteroidetes bacterium]|nr:MAG: RNA polymerase sigma factor [Bacteroidota bacterium]
MFSVEFNQLYTLHKDMVFNLSLQYVQNVEDAEEITQDVFLSIHRNLDKFRQEADYSTWIYRIAINKSLDFIKRKKRKKRFAFLTSLFYEDGNAIKHDHSDFSHPGVALEQKESVASLFKLINELPEKQKTVLILLKIDGRSQKEAALIMNLTEKAIESLLQRAKKNLDIKLAKTKDL